MPPALPLHGDLEHIVRRPKLRAELQGDDETTSGRCPFTLSNASGKIVHYFLVNLCRQERALWHPPSSAPHMSCPFAKLGLPPSASQDDVKAAYRLLGT